jgi:exopolysaccharide production protein ExoF
MLNVFHTLRCATIIWRSCLAAFLLACLSVGPLAAQDAYRMNLSDRIALRIVAWDTITLEFIEYDTLNGEYTIGSDGTMMVPLLGPIQAQGKSTAELAEELSAMLLVRLGLVETPSVSLTVVSYRPVYLLGAVRTPGAYTFSPGLTVQQALALAGGIEAVLDAGPDRLSTVIRTAGTLREIRIDMARQQIRAARLRAEMQGLADFAAPDPTDHPDGPTAMTAIINNERALFQSRREAQDRALAALDDNRRLLEAEITGLDGKQAGQTRQVALLREQVAKVEALVERGLARSPNFTAIQSQLIELENRQLDTETAVFRARQSIGELERDRVDIEAGRQLAVLRELQETEAEIDRQTSRRNTTRQLMAGAELLQADAEDGPTFGLAFAITRETAAGRVELEAGPETRMQPADVLEVETVLRGDGD